MEEYAGFWRRVLATVIDTLLFALIAGFVRYFFYDEAVMVSGFEFPLVSFANWFEQGVIILITVFMWVKFLGTPGKLILGCRVIDARSGRAINSGQAVLRYFAYLVSFLPLALGIFWIAWDKRKQGFHDKIAGTVVVLDSASRQRDSMDGNDESQKTLAQLMAELR